MFVQRFTFKHQIIDPQRLKILKTLNVQHGSYPNSKYSVNRSCVGCEFQCEYLESNFLKNKFISRKIKK